MSEEEVGILVICSKINNLGTEGRWTECVECTAEVWLSKTSEKAVRDAGHDVCLIRPNCLTCGLPKVHHENTEVMKMSKEQRQELISKAKSFN